MDLILVALLAEPAGFVAGALLLTRGPAILWDRSDVTVTVLAVLSALAAATAGASATGWAPLDVLLLAALGAGGVLAGLANPRLVLGVALLGAVAGIGSAGLPLALAASGLVLATLLMEDDSLVNAVATGLVVQAALRLHQPSADGATALVAAAILLPLAVSALRHAPSEHRRLARRAVLAAGALSLLGAGVGAAAAAAAVSPLRRGLAAVSNLVDAGGASNVEATSAGLADAGRDFARARGTLEAWWVRPAAVVPVVGQHWKVLRAAAVTGDELATAGRRALDAPALADVHITDGQVPLDQLSAVTGPVQKLAGAVTAARKRLDAAQSVWLVPPLADKLDVQLVRVRKIETTTTSVSRTLPLLPGLLGQDGPRRYFLAVVSPVELRAGGGFLGNFGEVTADHGRLSLTRFGRPQELDDASGEQRRLVTSAEFAERYSRFHPELDWANINLSPDFPTDAAFIASQYVQSGGQPVDGVIAVDPSALAALLRVVGEVRVASWPTPITADNAPQIMLYDQYVRYENDVRIDFLGDVAQETWRRLTSGVLPDPAQLLSALGPLVRTKHITLWSDRPTEQGLFEAVGAAGSIEPVRGDFVGLVTQNAAGNKIDYFLRRAVDYHVTLDPGRGKLEAVATVTLHNDAPSSGLPAPMIGNELMPPLPDGQNKTYLSFYTPWKLVGARLDGATIELEQATELGRQVYSTAVIIPSKGDATLELRLAGKLSTKGHYHLDVFRQLTVAPDDLSATLSVLGGREATITRRLDADLAVDLPVRR